ncbi:MAG: diguanylate cyclase [Thermodesulfobacteriota bacterium]
MPRVLLVEDSKMLAQVLLDKLVNTLGLDVAWASSLAETRKLLEEGSPEDYFAALLDLNLPDAPEGQVVDYVRGKGLASIVFTSELRPEVREEFWGKGIVDYVFKEGLHNLDYVLGMVARLERNPGITVLVVDDSSMARKHMAELLRIHRLQVLEAQEGPEALRLLEAHPQIKLVITDYNMPRMDGCQLTKAIRRTRSRDELAIIGVSAEGDKTLSAQFIKNGANDYLNKPFIIEEFYCRVNQNIETLEHMATIRRLSNSDPLTGLSNRRHFFHAAKEGCGRAASAACMPGLGMLDLDHFKQVNDTYGHEAGDKVLVHVAQLIRRHFSRDIVARFGGEEFCVLVEAQEGSSLLDRFEELRRAVEQSPVDIGGQSIHVTASIGVCTVPGSLEDMLRDADKALYAAKNAGRNRVVEAE